MIDMRHPLVVLAGRLLWSRIEAALATKFERQDRPSQQGVAGDMFGEHDVEFGGGVSNSGRPRLSIRLMASLLKSTEFCLSGEPEHVHTIGVLPIDDEFREGTVLSGSQQKCWQGVAQRGGDDKLRGRDAWADRSEPGAE